MVIASVQEQLRKANFEDFTAMKEACQYEDIQRYWTVGIGFYVIGDNESGHELNNSRKIDHQKLFQVTFPNEIDVTIPFHWHQTAWNNNH